MPASPWVSLHALLKVTVDSDSRCYLPVITLELFPLSLTVFLYFIVAGLNAEP